MELNTHILSRVAAAARACSAATPASSPPWLCLERPKILTDRESYYMDSTVETREKVRAKCERKITNLWGLTIHRGWARLLIDRTALLIREETFDSQDEEGEEGDGEEGIGEIH